MFMTGVLCTVCGAQVYLCSLHANRIYFILNLHRIKTMVYVSTHINFQHLNEFAKIRSTKINL